VSLSSDTSISLAESRLKEALSLLELGYHSGAYYLSGYAVELGLKAVIAKQILAGTIPDRAFIQGVYSHDLTKLLALAGLASDWKTRGDDDPVFAANWLLATQWSESSRYEMIDQFRALEMVNAVAEPDHGVVAWLRTHW